MAAIEPREIRRFFDAHGALLVLYARQWLESGLAEDVVQDAFMSLAAQPGAPDNVRAWLLKTVRNAALNQLRARRRRRGHERDATAGRSAWFERHPDDLLDAATAQAALAALPAEQREVVVLRIWGGMTLNETSEILALPVSTLWSRYQAALAALRERLESRCRTTKT